MNCIRLCTAHITLHPLCSLLSSWRGKLNSSFDNNWEGSFFLNNIRIGIIGTEGKFWNQDREDGVYVEGLLKM